MSKQTSCKKDTPNSIEFQVALEKIKFRYNNSNVPALASFFKSKEKMSSNLNQ